MRDLDFLGIAPEILDSNVMNLQDKLDSSIIEILLKLQESGKTDKEKFEKMKEDIFNNGHRLITCLTITKESSISTEQRLSAMQLNQALHNLDDSIGTKNKLDAISWMLICDKFATKLVSDDCYVSKNYYEIMKTL